MGVVLVVIVAVGSLREIAVKDEPWFEGVESGE